MTNNTKRNIRDITIAMTTGATLAMFTVYIVLAIYIAGK